MVAARAARVCIAQVPGHPPVKLARLSIGRVFFAAATLSLPPVSWRTRMNFHSNVENLCWPIRHVGTLVPRSRLLRPQCRNASWRTTLPNRGCLAEEVFHEAHCDGTRRVRSADPGRVGHGECGGVQRWSGWRICGSAPALL